MSQCQEDLQEQCNHVKEHNGACSTQGHMTCLMPKLWDTNLQIPVD